MKHASSTNDSKVKHPYMMPHNWLPGGMFCYWDKLRDSNPDYCERMDKWAESMQNSRPKENLITNNNSYL